MAFNAGVGIYSLRIFKRKLMIISEYIIHIMLNALL